MSKARIGVAISTRNRRDIADKSIREWMDRMPAGSRLVIVDDASDIPLRGTSAGARPRVKTTVIRHDVPLGVAMAKNAGIDALMGSGCTDLFLADDDIHPVTSDWWQPYIESPEQHLSWQWTTREPWTEKFDDGTHWAIGFPRGVLLYATRQVIDTVGGMDIAYGIHGGEHVEWQQRIHDAGFGTHPFMDVHGTSGRFWSLDKEQGGTVGSTIPLNERRELITANAKLWDKSRAQFQPYRDGRQDYELGPRLGDTYEATLDHVLTLRPHGAAVEFGVGEGHSLRRIAERMPVTGFDSFDGLPERWRDGFEQGMFACEPPTIAGAKLVQGLFADSLPDRTFGNVGLWHIDCDLYASTATILEHIGPHLQPGAYIVFDEWHSYPGSDAHEERAWREFADRTGIGWSVVGHGPEQWAIRIAP